MEEELQCCVVACEKPLDQTYWDSQYQSQSTGWDLGMVSPPIQTYIDTLENKNAKILIPGCGNTYEADYLLEKGFTNVTVIDISPTLVDSLKEKFKENKNISIVLGDFFDHEGSYDLILEQTFFCALPPSLRQKYVWKMHQLLNSNGILAGLLFDTIFEKQGPPFGGSLSEYDLLFKDSFKTVQMQTSDKSISKRMGTELWIELQKNENITVSLYQFEGMTCTSCSTKITSLYNDLPSVKNTSINTAFNEVLIVSEKVVSIDLLQETVAYDSKYKISKIG